MTQVLIVDDEEETVELLARIVKLLGHEPLKAGSCEAAMEFLELDIPDLVLLDLMMPGVDGYQTMEQIRAVPGAANVPIVVITASPELNLDQKVREAGGDAVYHKPISVAALSDAIESHMNQPDSAPLPAA